MLHNFVNSGDPRMSSGFSMGLGTWISSDYEPYIYIYHYDDRQICKFVYFKAKKNISLKARFHAKLKPAKRKRLFLLPLVLINIALLCNFVQPFTVRSPTVMARSTPLINYRQHGTSRHDLGYVPFQIEIKRPILFVLWAHAYACI